MESRCRRGRRCRGRSSSYQGLCTSAPCTAKSSSLLSGLYSFLILSSLIGIIYLMLDYHCNSCNSKCDINNINRSIADIAKNLSYMKNSYYDLEMKISRFSQELPKIEGQLEMLEAIANAFEVQETCWNPQRPCSLPGVDVTLSNEVRKNVTKCRRCQAKRAANIA